MSDRPKRPKKSHPSRSAKNYDVRVENRFRWKWPTHKNHLSLRMLIEGETAGILIGPKGSNIKETRNKHAEVDVCCPDSNTKDRVVQILADRSEDAEWNLQLLLDFMRDYVDRIIAEREQGKKDADNSYKATTIKLLIPEIFAKIFIGKGGQKIKEYRNKLHSIEIHSDEVCPGSTENVITISDNNTNNLVQVTEGYLRCFLEDADNEVYLQGVRNHSIRLYCGNYDKNDGVIAFYAGYQSGTTSNRYAQESNSLFRDERDSRGPLNRSFGRNRSRSRSPDFRDRKRPYPGDQMQHQMAPAPMMIPQMIPQMQQMHVQPGVMIPSNDGDLKPAEQLAMDMGLAREQFQRLRRQIIMDLL